MVSFFKGKRVLVTGDTGFKGSWLSLWLHTLGADVLGFALPPKRKEDHFHLLGLHKLIQHVDGDIRDLESMQKVFFDFKPEIVFHLAAQALVLDSYEDSKTTFDTNIGGSVNMLEAVRKTPSIKALIYVTSDKAYKNKEWIWGYRENDELGGRDPYSASKSAAEMVFASYQQSFFNDRKNFGCASVRAGNVIGGGDWSPNRILPDCIKSLQSGQSIEVRNPNATRPWQHILDPLSGYLLLASKLYEDPKQFSSAWNFGPQADACRSVKILVERVIDTWGSGDAQFKENKNAPHEAHLLHLNCDKAHQVLHWFPSWRFEDAVDQTVTWYKKVHEGISAIDMTTQQIKKFMEVTHD